jgi:spore coat protein H
MTRRFTFRTSRRLLLAVAVAVTLAVPARPAPAEDKGASGAAAFDPGKVWPVHITLSAEEYAAVQPRGGFAAPPNEPAKPAETKREVHRTQFGADLPWGIGSAVVGDQTFEKVGIRYKGNGTIFDTSRTIKKSFKIDLAREGGAGQFGGSKTIGRPSNERR